MDPPYLLVPNGISLYNPATGLHLPGLQVQGAVRAAWIEHDFHRRAGLIKLRESY